ncbi:MAG: pyrroloquinoline quinone-dependent dehydrogenase [Proteobacteria bacterium]|nr:pyrroloquinoline quinone-dependent dehydrogenase [Pseudomonadota bacterium]
MNRPLLALLASVAALGCEGPPPIDYTGPTADWPEYAGTKGGSHHSPLTQIDPGNVAHLELAWEHRSGDYSSGGPDHASTAFASTPLVVGDTLYYNTPYMRVFALDPETGREKWMFDPELRARESGGPYPLGGRGLAYWEEASPRPGQACARRLLYGTKDSELIALDAETGIPCPDFGVDGRVPLREGIDPEAPAWEYYPTSPPLIMGDVAVLGALVADQLRTDAPSGVVRGFDVRSGALVWAWDPVPRDWKAAPLPGEGYARGTPNVWAVLSGDEQRGLVFVPTGNASPDSFGAARSGLDYYASATVALDAATGEVVWRFKAVRHDVWDFDTPAQPQLFQIPGVGGGRPAVAQPTKMGFLFLLDRETGEPLYPIEERPVPQTGAVAEETLSPTQPFPTHPPPLHPEWPEPWGFTPWDRSFCEREFEKYRWDGFYTPPSLEGAIQFPHTSGGMNVGGVAIDSERGVVITNQTHVPMVAKLVPRTEYDQLDEGSFVYPQEAYPMRGTPYGLRRWTLLSNLGAPCSKPPWGTLKAVDLRSGEVLWERPLGTLRDIAPFPVWLFYGDVGVPNFGGGLSTAGGLYFIGASMDRYFRAFDVETGEPLWRYRIPYAANAAPMSYRLRPEGRQFVVVAAGGNPITGPGDALMAFALPD